MKFEIRTTERRVYPNRAPPARSVAQLPGSIYPTATISPGPAKAKSLRQKPAFTGTGIEENTSGKLGIFGSLLHPEVISALFPFCYRNGRNKNPPRLIRFYKVKRISGGNGPLSGKTLCAPFDRTAHARFLNHGDRLARGQIVQGLLQLFPGDLAFILPVVIDAAVINQGGLFLKKINIRRALRLERLGRFLRLIDQIRKRDPQLLDLSDHLIRRVVRVIGMDVWIDGDGIDLHVSGIQGQSDHPRSEERRVGTMVAGKNEQEPPLVVLFVTFIYFPFGILELKRRHLRP